MSKIIGAKLVTKELVVGKLHESGGIDNPLLIVPVAKQNSVTLQLAPYLPPLFQTDASPAVRADDIMITFEIPEEIQKGYIEAITGISIVSNVDSRKVVKDIMSGKHKKRM